MTYLIIFLILLCIFVIEVKTKHKLLWKDFISPKRWRSFYIYLLKKQLKYFGENEKYLTKNELLQYSYRVAQCTDCLIAGNCVNCGCDAEGRINNTTDYCSAKKFGEFLSDEEMNELLKNNDFILKAEIKSKSNV